MPNQTPLPSRQLTEFLYRKSAALHYPLSGTFELSPVCNFACRMCYVRKTAAEVARSPRPILQTEDWRRIAREAREAGMLYLLLTGGEPLLQPDFWPLYEELVRMGFLVSVNTNGSLIDDEAIARFRALPPRQINITLYGASDATYRRLCAADGVFRKVDHAINGLQKAGVQVKLNCSLTPANAGDLEEMIRYAETRGLPMTAASYMFPPVRRDAKQVGVNEGRFTPEQAAFYRLEVYRLQNGRAAWLQLLEAIRSGYLEPPGLDEGCVDPLDGKIRCRAAKASFWVTWDGKMTPCGLMAEPFADLTAVPFAEAWRQLTEAGEGLTLSGSCERCANFKICHPCAAIAVAETGCTEGIPVYLCRAAREMRRIAEEELNKVNRSDRNDPEIRREES